MNYKLASVFSYERFEYALICIISMGPSTRLRPILNFPIFRKNGVSLERLNIVFESSLPKGFFGEIKNNSHFLIWHPFFLSLLLLFCFVCSFVLLVFLSIIFSFPYQLLALPFYCWPLPFASRGSAIDVFFAMVQFSIAL